MVFVLLGILLIAGSGLAGALGRRELRGGELSACALVLTGCGFTLLGVLAALVQGGAALRLPWAVPGGALALRLDALTAAFILPLLLVVAAGPLYGLGYWPQRRHPENARRLRLFYGLISAAMLLLLCARNAVLFLTAWEVMALSGFFLITTEDRKPEVRRAGFIYLIATHTGTLCLFALFALLAQRSGGSLMFPAVATVSASGAGLLFILGLLGFGMKAGLMPLHIWLPGAHAAAPSHASALLSGVMIKTGIYGLMRLTSFFSHIPHWWGWTLLGLGAVSAVMGVALALAQHDIKRLLAYHSVENIGIIVMGLGLALLGRSHGIPALVVLGLAGALLHVANHGLFKSLLFLSAGSVIHAVGSRQMDHFGGLLKRQRGTGLLFLGGAVAISGLPPFNGFVSEWLIYLGAFQPLKQTGHGILPTVLVAPALALTGALALACFAKVFGVCFLGDARSEAARMAKESPAVMLGPMTALLAACAWIGLVPSSVGPLLEKAAACWAPSMPLPSLASGFAPLGWVGLAGWVLVFLALAAGLALYRRSLGAPRDQGTWGCGYTLPTARMQYTASSFADSLVGLFRFGLRSERHGGEPQGLFPPVTALETHTPDLVLDRGLEPAFSGAARIFCRVRKSIQNGFVSIYLLYVALTLVVLLWQISR